VHGVVDACASLPQHRLDVGPVGRCAVGSSEVARELERLVEKLHRFEQRVGQAELVGLRRRQQPVLPQWVEHDHLGCDIRADEAGQQLRAAPRRDDRERDLRKADVAHVVRERARRAVERELEAAAERGAVDGRDGGEGQRADPSEQLVSGANTLPRVLGGARAREFVDVGADAEDEGLAREDGRGPVAVLELVEDANGGVERGPAERRRLAMILAVVDRHERDRPDGVQLELRAAAQVPSQRIAQPMPMPTQSAVRP